MNLYIIGMSDILLFSVLVVLRMCALSTASLMRAVTLILVAHD